MNDFEEVWGFPCTISKKGDVWQVKLPHDFPKEKIPPDMGVEKTKNAVAVIGTAHQILTFLKSVDDDTSLPDMAMMFN